MPLPDCLAIRLAALALLVPAPRPAQEAGPPFVPPGVGEVAPPLGDVQWYFAPDGTAPVLAALRGKVVLVHTWGYYCGPCMKAGVPYVVDLMRANREQGLAAVSLTVAVGDDQPAEHFVEVGRSMGMEHPLGLVDGFGEMSPYLNLNKSKALTWCFVIGREGGVRWLGDPSQDGEAFLEAVRTALAEDPAPALEERPPAELAKALARYVSGDLARAREELEKLRAKAAKKGDETVQGPAARLLEGIDAYRAELVRRIDAGIESGDDAGYLTARRALRTRFGKTAEEKHLTEIEGRIRADPAHAAALQRATAWEELRLARPALFPARVDKETRRYAKQLEAYVRDAPDDLPGLAQARTWLQAFAAQH